VYSIREPICLEQPLYIHGVTTVGDRRSLLRVKQDEKAFAGYEIWRHVGGRRSLYPAGR